MAVSYKKLRKIPVDRYMTGTQLKENAGISTGAFAKPGRNENMNTETLVKICITLH